MVNTLAEWFTLPRHQHLRNVTVYHRLDANEEALLIRMQRETRYVMRRN